MKARLRYRFTVVRFRLLGIWYRISRYKVLKFDTEDFDERTEHRQAAQAQNICLALQEFDNWLRNKEKYSMAEERTRGSIEDAFCYEVRNKLREFMSDEGVNLNEIL